MNTLTLKKDTDKKKKPGPGCAYLIHWHGRNVTVTLSTGTTLSGKLEGIATYDVLLLVDGRQLVLQKQHIVTVELVT